jgi:hypothetical protein
VSTASKPGSPEEFNFRALIAQHKRGSALIAAAVLAVIALTVATTLTGANPSPLSDSTTCSAWAAASTAQKTAYAHLYINEYGDYANTDANAAAVRADVNQNCVRAAYLGEADDVTVLSALHHEF